MRALLLLVLLASITPLAACGDDDTAPTDGSTEPDGGRVMRDGGPRPDDGGTIDALTVRIERATPEQIALHLVVERALADESRLTVRYKIAAEAEWRDAHPLLRIHPEWVTGGAPEAPVDSFAGTIFDLVPGETYDLEITLEEPGMPAQTITAVATTRALPAEAGAATATVTPSDDLQAAFDALEPGDVLELADGTYDVDGLFIASSGTEAAPIYVRGASRAGVVLRNSGRVLQIQDASNVVFENFTMEGSGTDSGTDASSVAVSFWDGAMQDNVTFRHIDARGVDQGIIGYGRMRGVLIYDCDLRGNNVWTPEFIETNLTWNDDGITIPGEGNVAFENTLHGFGDSFAVRDGTHSSAIYFYRNRIAMTGDDSFEGDYGTRNMAFYDNFITNCSTLLSLDPLWGGPLYCFRNVVINTVRGPFKLNNTNSGFFIYNNTIVRTEGTTEWGWVQFNNGDLRAWAYRNNVLIYRGTTGNLLAVESGGNDPIDFTHNAWFPDGSVWWTNSGGSFGSIDETRAGLSATMPLFSASTMRHESDVVTTADPFASPVTLGGDHLTEVTIGTPPALAAGSSPKNTGVAIPNVTDGFSGAAPDMGGVIEGRPAPRRGASRP